MTHLTLTTSQRSQPLIPSWEEEVVRVSTCEFWRGTQHHCTAPTHSLSLQAESEGQLPVLTCACLIDTEPASSTVTSHPLWVVSLVNSIFMSSGKTTQLPFVELNGSFLYALSSHLDCYSHSLVSISFLSLKKILFRNPPWILLKFSRIRPTWFQFCWSLRQTLNKEKERKRRKIIKLIFIEYLLYIWNFQVLLLPFLKAEIEAQRDQRSYSFICGKVGPKSRPFWFKGAYSLHNNSIYTFLLGLLFSFKLGHCKTEHSYRKSCK